MGMDYEVPCLHCDRIVGDHTLREWDECAAKGSEDLPYEDMDAPMTFNHEGRTIPMSDHVVVKALTVGGLGQSGVEAMYAGLAFTFSSSDSRAGGVQVPVCEVLFIAGKDTMVKAGKLMRDSANGAANKVSR